MRLPFLARGASGPRPRLVFHVGSHKTGTTAIQRTLSAMRDDLPRRGLIYPDPGPAFGAKRPLFAHFAVIRAVANYDQPDRRRLARFADAARAAATDGGTVVLSAETAYRMPADIPGTDTEDGFWDARRVLLIRLREVFAAFDVSFLMWLRRPEALAEAQYAEAVAGGDMSEPFDAFLGQRPYRYAYRRQIDLFRSIAPLDVRIYETDRRTGLLAGLSAALDLSEPLPEPGGPTRPSLPVRAIVWLQREKAARDPDRAAQDRMWRFALTEGAAHFGGPPASLWRSEAARSAFARRSLDPVPELVFPPPPELPHPLAWTDRQQRDATAAFEAWEAANHADLAAREMRGMRPFEDAAPPKEGLAG